MTERTIELTNNTNDDGNNPVWCNVGWRSRKSGMPSYTRYRRRQTASRRRHIRWVRANRRGASGRYGIARCIQRGACGAVLCNWSARRNRAFIDETNRCMVL